jgi:hypothetical protein
MFSIHSVSYIARIENPVSYTAAHKLPSLATLSILREGFMRFLGLFLGMYG